MKILIVGGGQGSWDIRGVQLGAAMSARVTGRPTAEDWRWAEVIVLVKRYGVRFAGEAHETGAPVVWDALDFWSQPIDNASDEARARALLGLQLTKIRPALTLGATEAMTRAIEGLGAAGAYLPHHAWRGLDPMPIQPTVTTVAYQGNVEYLTARWGDAIRRACARRGWTFILNPETLWRADILVAFRADRWDGWMCQEWKSGVKLVNALAAGRPVITQDSAAWREIEPSGTAIADPAALDDAFEQWTSGAARQQALEAARRAAPAYKLSAVAGRYRAILDAVRTACPKF